MVGTAGEIGRFRLGGEDIEALIKLEGIRVDDLAVQAFGHVERETGFPRGGGSHDKKSAGRKVFFQRPQVFLWQIRHELSSRRYCGEGRLLVNLMNRK